MKCISNKKTGETKRVNNAIAKYLVNSGEWHYTSKGCYKSLKPR